VGDADEAEPVSTVERIVDEAVDRDPEDLYGPREREVARHAALAAADKCVEIALRLETMTGDASWAKDRIADEIRAEFGLE
jgi:hypothetical protein